MIGRWLKGCIIFIYITLELSHIYKVHLFIQNFILPYSPHLCDSNAHIFILNGAIFIEL